LNRRWDVLHEFGDVVEQGETVTVDLSLPEDQLFRQMRMNHRRVIRRLRSLEITSRVDDNWTQLDEFVRIYHETMTAAGAAPWYFFPRHYFEELRQAVGPSLMLKLVERRGELLAAGIFSQCNGLVQYHLGATSSAARALSPSRLMLYAACEWGKEQGNLLLHLGGGVQGRPDSLFHFKAGFSPLRARFATWRVITIPSVFQAATHHWEKISGSDRPLLDGYFPPYRKAYP
jgi:lipid II:glycine glycyltransferase (peptidoglycan interpeptide bridge formation enzyme)